DALRAVQHPCVGVVDAVGHGRRDDGPVAHAFTMRPRREPPPAVFHARTLPRIGGPAMPSSGPMFTEEVGMTDQERVVVETRIGAPADDVWRAMRDPDRIRQWFGWDDHGLDDEIAHIVSVLAAADDDARTLVWEDGDRIEVAEHDDGAFVRVVRTGARPRDWDGVYDAVDEGWITFVQQLRFLLERHPGQY